MGAQQDSGQRPITWAKSRRCSNAARIYPPNVAVALVCGGIPPGV